MTRMDYLRQSFTLPNKKKTRYPPNFSNEVSVKGIPIGSAKMKANKVKSLKQGDTDVLVGDRLEDIYATLPKRQVPDFYGGDMEVEVKKPPVALDDNFLSVSTCDISSDYGSEFDLSFRRNGRSTLYATLRRGKKKLFDKSSTVDSRRSSTSTVVSSGTGSLPESPPESDNGSIRSSNIYGTIGRCTSKRREALPPWLCDTSTSLPTTPSLELAPTTFREPPPFVQPPASMVGSLEDLHQSDTSSVKSFGSSTSASTYSNPKEHIYLRPAMLGTAPLQPSPANHHPIGQNVYKSAEELSSLCSCRERCAHSVSGYRVRACKTMEPLWESEDQVQLRRTSQNWYDMRKAKHKSCPAFQAHMVAAFEQSLSNMTSRLQHLTATAEQKDSELMELRKTIEALQQQSAEAGLTKAALQSMQAVQRSNTFASKSLPHLDNSQNQQQQQQLGVEEENSGFSKDKDALLRQDKRSVVRRHTFNTSAKENGSNALHSNDANAGTPKSMPRQLSSDSMSSVNSANSQSSQHQNHHNQVSQLCKDRESSLDALENNLKKNKKKKSSGWLRTSFGKAFSRGGSGSGKEDGNGSDSSVPNSPQVPRSCPLPAPIQEADETEAESKPSSELVEELRKQLRDKDMVLTDIRLEALSSAHQLDQMKELVAKLKSEITHLKADNERLSRLVGAPGQNSENSSQCSIPSLLKANSLESVEKRLSSSDQSGSPTVDMYLNDNIQESRDSKKIPVSVHLGISGDLNKLLTTSSEIFIGCVAVSNKTSWTLLDAIVRKAFKEYVLKIDPASNLGLSAESVQCYHIGDMVRQRDLTPELLPCGYLVGNDMQIKVVVKGTDQSSLDALAFETLIPKSILARYVSLLMEHKRIILCGPSGTGKTFLAQKLAEFLSKDSERGEEAIPTFNVDRGSQGELKNYLANIAEQSESGEVPQVVIVDNLHHVASLSDVFNPLFHANAEKCPFIIGTMNQARCSTTNLQLNHNFRWVLCANHIEPVKGLLGRCLRRRLVDHEARTGLRSSPELQHVIDWMPQVWMHVNKFLETHNSADATIGPRLFLTCPVDLLSAQVWFTDLWNYTIVPYLVEAAREGLQLHGQRAPWEDPLEWVKQSYPFEHKSSQELVSVREDDITSGETTLSNRDSDPLLNMLMRLQEAASYSPQTSLTEATADCS